MILDHVWDILSDFLLLYKVIISCILVGFFFISCKMIWFIPSLCTHPPPPSPHTGHVHVVLGSLETLSERKTPDTLAAKVFLVGNTTSDSAVSGDEMAAMHAQPQRVLSSFYAGNLGPAANVESSFMRNLKYPRLELSKQSKWQDVPFRQKLEPCQHSIKMLEIFWIDSTIKRNSPSKAHHSRPHGDESIE